MLSHAAFAIPPNALEGDDLGPEAAPERLSKHMPPRTNTHAASSACRAQSLLRRMFGLIGAIRVAIAPYIFPEVLPKPYPAGVA